MQIKPSTNLVRVFVVPAKSIDKLWWDMLDTKGDVMTLPISWIEFDVERKDTLTSPWVLFTSTNRPPVQVLTSGFYRVGRHDK